MAKSPETAPLSELIGGLVADVTGLLRKEIDLAKTEVSEKFSQALNGVEVVMFGLVLAVGAVGVLLSALVAGVAAFLVTQGLTETSAGALASLIVGVVIALIAWAMVSRGLTALRRSNMKLDRTATSLRRDVDVVKEKIWWKLQPKKHPPIFSERSIGIASALEIASTPFKNGCRQASWSMRSLPTQRAAAGESMLATSAKR